jgi:hypothetical protein
VHLSSSPEFEELRFGKGLQEQLRRALWTEVLVLVRSYCMRECGVATRAGEPATNEPVQGWLMNVDIARNS